MEFVIQLGKTKYATEPLDPDRTTVGDLKTIIWRLTRIPPLEQHLSSRRSKNLSKCEDIQKLTEVCKGLRCNDIFLVVGTPKDEREGNLSDVDVSKPIIFHSGVFKASQQLEVVNKLGQWVWQSQSEPPNHFLFPLEAVLFCLFLENSERAVVRPHDESTKFIAAAKRAEARENSPSITHPTATRILELDVALCCSLAGLLSIPFAIVSRRPLQPITTVCHNRRGHMFCHTFGDQAANQLNPSNETIASCHLFPSSEHFSPELISSCAIFENIPVLRSIADPKSAQNWSLVYQGGVSANSTTITRYILKRFPKLAATEKEAFSVALQNDFVSVLKVILNSPNAIDPCSDEAQNWLFYCVQHRAIKCCAYLATDLQSPINKKVKMYAPSVLFRDGRRPSNRKRNRQTSVQTSKKVAVTPLWLCVAEGASTLAASLIAAGADILQSGPHSLLTLAYFVDQLEVAALVWVRAQHRALDQQLLEQLASDAASYNQSTSSCHREAFVEEIIHWIETGQRGQSIEIQAMRTGPWRPSQQAFGEDDAAETDEEEEEEEEEAEGEEEEEESFEDRDHDDN